MGDANSYHNLGVMLSNGIGAKKDRVSANKFYLKAALMGHAGSQINLGWSYYKGTGIKKNLGLAIYWLTRSADQGEPFAYGSIGEMTYYGHGFPFDKIEAVKWLTLADEQMPEGKTRNENHAILQKLKNKMNEDDVISGTNLARSWLPLKQSKSLMGEKCNP
jgi:TPR repeat protein